MLSSANALNWSAIVAAGVFVLSQIISLVTNFYRQRREKKHLAKGLLAEIHLVLKRGGEASDPSVFRSFVEKFSVQQINAYSFVSFSFSVYEKNIDKIGIFPDSLVYKIVEFYSLAGRTNDFINHFKSDHFVKSDEHVHCVMKELLIRTIADLHKVGHDLVDKLEIHAR